MNENEMKMIKEMAEILIDTQDKCELNPCNECEHRGCREGCWHYLSATELYKKGGRIVADDEIVIKKREYDTLLRSYTLTYDNAYQWGLKVGVEKTAIEILQKLKDNIMFADFGCGDGYEEVVDINTDELKELAKSYGIELED